MREVYGTTYIRTYACLVGIVGGVGGVVEGRHAQVDSGGRQRCVLPVSFPVDLLIRQ